MHEISRTLTINVYKEGEIWIVHCSNPELASQGSNPVEALKNFTEAYKLSIREEEEN